MKDAVTILNARIDSLLDENKHLRSALTDFKSALLECGRERERLREALEEIAESDELAQHIAKQALKQEKQNGQ